MDNKGIASGPAHLKGCVRKRRSIQMDSCPGGEQVKLQLGHPIQVPKWRRQVPLPPRKSTGTDKGLEEPRLYL